MTAVRPPNKTALAGTGSIMPEVPDV